LLKDSEVFRDEWIQSILIEKSDVFIPECLRDSFSVLVSSVYVIYYLSRKF
jgi:hypothetical protein